MPAPVFSIGAPGWMLQGFDVNNRKNLVFSPQGGLSGAGALVRHGYPLHGLRVQHRLQSGMVMRTRWLVGLVALLAGAAFAGLHFWRVQRPPTPSAAKLPASVRTLLQPFRRDGIDLKVAANGQLEYRVGMQAGASLVYAWTASQPTVSYQFADQKPGRAGEAHGAFVAQSAGWYRWRWTNPTGTAVTIHLKLSGYYEPTAMPPAGMTYDR
jgi:hypothetical protein